MSKLDMGSHINIPLAEAEPAHCYTGEPFITILSSVIQLKIIRED